MKKFFIALLCMIAIFPLSACNNNTSSQNSRNESSTPVSLESSNPTSSTISESSDSDLSLVSEISETTQPQSEDSKLVDNSALIEPNSDTETSNDKSSSDNQISNQNTTFNEITKTDRTSDDYLTDTKLYKYLFQPVMSGEKCCKSVEYDLDDINDKTVEEIQVKGNMLYRYTKDFDDEEIFISRDGYNYYIDVLKKSYYKRTNSNDNTIQDMYDSIKYIAFVENGVSDKEGCTDYEKYSDMDNDGDYIYVYFNGNDIKYLEEVERDGDTERVEIELTEPLGDEVFEIPSGYTVKQFIH